MLYLYQSSVLKSLADQFLKEANKKPSNPLKPDRIILQNNQMKRWLQKFIARKKGIAANIKTQFPGEFIWDIYRQMDCSLPETLPCEREPMQFSIFDILQSRNHQKKLNPLYKFIQTEVEGEAPERAWNLSIHIADLFDRYQIYRPEMIIKWQQKQLQTNSEHEKWQAALWRILQEKWNDLPGDLKWKNRAELHYAFLKDTQNKTRPAERLRGPVTVFAVPTLAPVFLQTFIQLSEHIDVNFYWLNINQSKKIDQKLTDSWGDPRKEFLELFKKTTDVNPIKCEVKTGRPQSRQLDEENIQVHSCHSAKREVEVLYDQLLALFDENSDLNPADVLITTPDIETYAPLIHAVFGSPETGQPGIPYHIADHNLRPDPYAQTFIKLLNLLESRFKVTEVLDILNTQPARNAFDLSQDDLSRLERWIDDNNIRWGVDADFKAEKGLPSSNHFTWRAGLYRMMLGSAMEAENFQLLNEIFAYPEIYNSADALLAGKLNRFLNQLFELREKVQKKRPIHKWADILLKAAQIFLPDDAKSGDEFSSLAHAVEKLAKQEYIAGVEQNVPFKIVFLWLQNELIEKPQSGGRSGRGVTFSPMLASRNIPFKVIGMIGMNDDAFPRKDVPLGFDLMKTDKQTGDPNRLKEDRYLFLEALNSAQKYCYFSYVGQSNREEADFPPSVLITELLDSLNGKEAAHIVQKHPLQNFSADYFKDNDLFTYAAKRRNAAAQLTGLASEKKSWLGVSLPQAEEESKNISVSDLISYYQNPAKYVLKNKLGLLVKDEKIIDEDRELFVLTGLNKYSVKQDIIEAYFKNHSFEGLKTLLKAQDRLPEGWPGNQAFKQISKSAQTFGDQVLEKQGERAGEEVKIDLEIDDLKLTGEITGYYPPLFLDFRFGRKRAKDLVAWWIKHVILSIQISSEINSVLLTWKDEKLGQDELGVLESPEIMLKELLAGYREGIQKIGCFFPRSSFKFAEQIYKKDSTEDKAVEKAQKEWQPNDYSSVPSESEDKYTKLVTGDKNPLEYSSFKDEARRFWEPFFNAYNPKN